MSWEAKNEDTFPGISIVQKLHANQHNRELDILTQIQWKTSRIPRLSAFSNKRKFSFTRVIHTYAQMQIKNAIPNFSHANHTTSQQIAFLRPRRQIIHASETKIYTQLHTYLFGSRHLFKHVGTTYDHMQFAN